MDTETSKSGSRRVILFFDGDCGLCTRSVRFFMRRDKSERIQYAPLQGKTAADCLPIELRKSEGFSTVVLYLEGTEDVEAEILVKSSAIEKLLIYTGGAWAIWGNLINRFPKKMSNFIYDIIAKHRHRFLPQGPCSIPTPDERARILD